MKNIKSISHIFVILISFQSFFCFAKNFDIENEKLLFVSDVKCPFVCEPDKNYDGFLVDMARLLFESMDKKIDYKIMSWKNAIKKFNNSEVDGILGARIYDVKDAVFPKSEQAKAHLAIFSNSTNNWEFYSQKSLDNRVLGVTDAYSYDVLVRSHINSNILIFPEKFVFSESNNPSKENVIKLMKNQVFAFPEYKEIIDHFQNKSKVNNIKFAGYTSNQAQMLYIAFPKTKGNSDRYAEYLSQMRYDLRFTDKIEKLYKKYGLEKNETKI